MSLYATNRFAGDGATTAYTISFVGGYLDKTHVQAYQEDDLTSVRTPVTLTPGSFVGPYQLAGLPVTPIGSTLVILRVTPAAPLVDFTNGSRLTEKALDLATRQGLFVAVEAMDLVGPAALDDLRAAIEQVYVVAATMDAKVSEASVAAAQAAQSAVDANAALSGIQQSVTDAVSDAAEAITLAAGANDRIQRLVRDSRKPLFMVQPNKSIQAPDGSRFVVKGVTMFDYLFIGHEPRTNYLYRNILNPTGTGPSAGISEPTYYARLSYIDTDHVVSQLRRATLAGINLIRVAIEPAIMRATVPYVDPNDGLTYPPDLVMLDNIIEQAGILGIVVQLQNANDHVTIEDTVPFLEQIAERYKGFPWVWINPANELNGSNGSGNVNNVAVWESTMALYVSALRGPLATAGRFQNPIVINPPYFGNNLAGVVPALTTNYVLRDDPNLIIGIHVYALAGEADFRTTRLPTETAQWFQYLDQFCIFIDEVGIDNFAGRYDPGIDPGVPSVDMVAWERMQSWASDFLRWSWEQSTLHSMNGLTGFMWFAYIPGLALHDDNTMLKTDGSLTTWGALYVNNYSAHPIRRLDMRRSLGADFATGAWSSGDILDGSVTNEKLAATWNEYSPTVTSSSGTLTGVSATGRWVQVAKVVTFQIAISVSTNGTGAGALIVTLPVVAYGASHACSGLQAVNNFACIARTTQGVNTLTVFKYDGTYPAADGAQFLLTGSYETV